ncbi:TetR/AcrR family transcriptional regulator [Williamsia maris]|uniref:Transcriptional regulator, TetR family n=1 Tax=Williamsia maris TaxID=72806 RepID=A0ABT1HBB6_9NOCA|nr:TetR/AcrR family transcriptional regulator [Williamsia maris]MCP2175040.1 transcriptional regulator, TetR family [Williamsia maris]
MTQVVDPRARIELRARDKFQAKRTELAQATLHTLAELGYARTSLREIAQNSEYSHGVLHYYFSDKLDLLSQAVSLYEATCVTRYDEAVEAATSAEKLLADFENAYFHTLVADAKIHRLWYDLRNQSLFEASFRSEVLDIEGRREAMIWRVVVRYCELSEQRTAAVDQGVAYMLLDGIFHRALLAHFAGDADVVTEGRAQLRAAFAIFLADD